MALAESSTISTEIALVKPLRTCPRCHMQKSVDEFYVRPEHGGYRSHCKQCWSEKSQQKRLRELEQNPDGFREHEATKARQHRAQNIERARERDRLFYQRRKIQYPEKHIASIAARTRALEEKKKQDPIAFHLRTGMAKKKWKQNHPEQRRAQGRKDSSRRYHRLRTSGICDLTIEQKNAIFQFYGNKCYYCGKKSVKLTIDHIVPLSRDGDHTYSNIVPACRSCNGKKRDRAPLIPVQPLLVDITICNRES